MRIVCPQRFVSKEESDIDFGFFGRQGGVSEGIFSSLNCGPGSEDAPEAVRENRMRVAQAFNVSQENLVSLWQCHSNLCLKIESSVPEGPDRPKADAMVTDRPGLALGVLTADCGPVLFTGRKADRSPVIGAAHAGWRGAVDGVLENTINEMMRLGAIHTTIKTAVGPCIGPKSYEVTQGFEEPFLKEDPSAEHFFKSARKDGHLMFDLPGYIAARLRRAGVKDIYLTDHDTYTDTAGCFSYRRASHAGESDYGRQISAITIRKSA